MHTPAVTLIVSESEHGLQENQEGRVAFVAGKKNGNAVWRNAAKRRMREVYRRLPAEYVQGRDIIFLAKGKILSFSFAKVVADCERGLSR